MRHRFLFVSAFLLLVMCGYLIANFPADSFWYDETVSGYLTLDSWDALWTWTTQTDIQPPLYFGSLKLWAGAAGTSEFALRYYSLLAGFLGLAGIMQLGKRISRAHTGGWGAALALFFSGGFVYATGEARTYALVLTLSIWSLVFLEAALRKNSFWRVLGYGVLTIAAIYAHYTVIFLVVAQGLYVFFTYPKRQFLIFLLPGLSYIPWTYIIAKNGMPEGLAFEGAVPLKTILQTYWQFFLFGQVVVDEAAAELGWIIAGLAAALLIFLLWKKRLPILVLLIGILPIVILTLSIRLVEAKLSGRHGWALWIGMALLAGLGVRYWQEKWKNPLVHLVAVGVVFFVYTRWPENLPDIYPSHLNSAFAYINENAQPSDFLILRDGSLYTAAEYYRTPLNYIGFPNVVILNVNHQLNFIEAQHLLKTHLPPETRNLWIVSWDGEIMDPQELTFGMAEYIGGLPQETIYFGDVYVARYAYQRDTADMLDHVMDLQDILKIGKDGPSLLGVEVYYEETYPNCPVIFHAWWWRGEKDYPNARISYRLLGSEDVILAQYDFELSGQIYPQKKWPPVVPVLGRAELRIPAGVDQVTAAIVVYDLNNEQPPQHAKLGEILVTSGSSGYCDYVVLLP
ncbi:MAG: glycosyltransferase family 39 protein, partial [Anaerolineae bacterium]|nr:glycosyltransferase family 39 protein [Anaerolineae bacterium]